MSFFALKATCSVCNKEIGMNRKRIANKGWICNSCYKEANLKPTDFTYKSITKWTVDDFKTAIEANKENKVELNSFNPTKKIGSFIEFDDNQQKWLVPGFLGNKKKSIVYDYSDIVDFELLEDGESIATGGLGRALVGGALFGGAGAIVGGVTGKRKNKGVCNNLEIKVTINDINNPAVFIKFVTSSMKKNGFLFKSMYEDAQECLSTLQVICDQQNVPEENVNSSSSAPSAAEEIKKYKELLDLGAISEEEYELKKKELLNL